MVQVLTTDGGIQHSPAKWGKATAAEILPFDASLSGPRLASAELLRAAFGVVMERYHATLQSIERSLLQADPLHVHTAHGSPELVESAMEELISLTKGSHWEHLWGRSDVQEMIAEIIDSHYRTNQHLERMQWAADNAADSEAQAYKTFFDRTNS